MNIAFASLVLRLPAVVPDPVEYYWVSGDYDNYVSDTSASWGVGLGGELGLFPTPSGAFLISLDGDIRHRAYDSDYPMAFTTVSVPLDVGWRFDTQSFGASGPVGFWFGVGLGPRFTYLAVDGWQDQLAIAGGFDTFIGLTLGTGPVRGNLGASVGFDWPGGSSYGQATLPDSYVNWSFTSGGIVASMQAGVEFR